MPPKLRRPGPKHAVITETLLAAIEAGRWRAGERIPSEDELVAETGASLGTVQKSLNALARMGVVVRQHGRGTFVIGVHPFRHVGHFRFLAEDNNSVLPMQITVIGVAVSAETGPWSRFLGTDPQGYVCLRRVASIAGEFRIFNELYLSRSRFPEVADLDQSALERSLREYIQAKHNLPTLKVQQSFVCHQLPPRATEHMGVPAGTTGMIWTVGGKSLRDVPITWQRSFVPPSDRPLEVLPISELNVQSEFLRAGPSND